MASRLIAIIITLLALVQQSVGSPSGASVHFTVPKCADHKYALPTMTQDGNPFQVVGNGLFCIARDFAADPVAGTELVEDLNTRLSSQRIVEVEFSSFYYTDINFARWFCSLKFSIDAKITVFFQRSTDDAYLSPAFANALKECPVTVRYLAVGCNIFASGDDDEGGGQDVSCSNGDVNVIHTKLARFVLESGDVVMLAGSGNFNKSLYANVEDWVVMQLPVGDAVERQVACMFSVLKDVAGVPEVSPIFAEALYAGCRSYWSANAPDRSVAFDMMPAPTRNRFKERLLSEIKGATRVEIAAQALEDPDVLKALMDNAGAKVRLVLDDDYYWTLLTKTQVGVVKYEKATLLAPLIARPNVETRYLMTNHRGEGDLRNTLHLRLAITQDQDGKVVFTGSPHFKRGSYVLNFEHTLILSDPTLVMEYEKFIDEIWNLGLPFEAMPRTERPIEVGG